MGRRIVLFNGALDTLNLFSAQLKNGFEALGDYEIFEFDMRDILKSMGEFYAFLQGGRIHAMIGFNSTFYGMTLPSGANMCEQLQIPCINILVDHPYWYPEILEKMPPLGVVLCVDRGHMEYVERFYPQIAVNGFLPHGGTGIQGLPRPIAEREIDVLYAGSLLAAFAERQKPDFTRWDFPAEEICEAAIQRLLATPGVTVERALEDEVHRCGVEMTDAELCRFISSCVYVERVVSSHFREKILRGIARAGIPLELYGDGWEECDWARLPNVRYGGRVSPEEILEKMENSKIVLNTMPWFKDGSHERVFNGMLRGALVCSETSGYFAEEFPPDVGVFFELSPESIESLPQKIRDMLRDTAAMQQMAAKGYGFAVEKHTWQARAAELDRDLLGIWE